MYIYTSGKQTKNELENQHAIHGKMTAISMVDFSIVMLNNQRVYIYITSKES